MSATPARDALVFRWADAVFVDRILANPDLVLAALIESGWTPSDDDLWAMGLELRTDYEHVSTWRFPKEATDGE